MCDKAVDDSLAALQIKRLKLYIALYADENILYFNGDSGNVVFSCNEMGILNIELNTNLDNNFDKDDLNTIIFIRLLAWHIKFEKCKEPVKGDKPICSPDLTFKWRSVLP